MHVKSLFVAMVTFVIVILLALCAHAQTPPEPTSACSVDKKGMNKGEKKLVDLKCKLEQQQVQSQLDAEAKQDRIRPLIAPGSVGAVKDNKAVITATYRSQEGVLADGTRFTAVEKSKGWTSHEEKLEREKNRCWFWNGCSGGSNGGNFGTGGGTAGQSIVQPVLVPSLPATQPPVGGGTAGQR